MVNIKRFLSLSILDELEQALKIQFNQSVLPRLEKMSL